MSNIYEVIDRFGIEEAQKNKLKIYLMKNREVREELFSALQSPQTKESKMSLLEDFLKTIPGMLDKIFAVILFVTLRLNLFFCSLSRACGFR